MAEGVRARLLLCMSFRARRQVSTLLHDFVPNFSVCLQEFLRVHGAEAGVGRQLLRAKIQNLFCQIL